MSSLPHNVLKTRCAHKCFPLFVCLFLGYACLIIIPELSIQQKRLGVDSSMVWAPIFPPVFKKIYNCNQVFFWFFFRLSSPPQIWRYFITLISVAYTRDITFRLLHIVFFYRSSLPAVSWLPPGSSSRWTLDQGFGGGEWINRNSKLSDIIHHNYSEIWN